MKGRVRGSASTADVALGGFICVRLRERFDRRSAAREERHGDAFAFLDPRAKLGLGALAGELLRTGGIARVAGEGDPRLAPGGALSGDALDDLLESRAAAMEVAIGESSGSASLSCLAEDFARLLPLFAAMLRHPAFDAARLDLARDLAKSRLEREIFGLQAGGFVF